jgi:hypothetical protein
LFNSSSNSAGCLALAIALAITIGLMIFIGLNGAPGNDLEEKIPAAVGYG